MSAVIQPQFSEAPYFLPTSPAAPVAVPTQMNSVPTWVDRETAQFLLQRARLVAADGTLLKGQVNKRPISWELIRRFTADMIDGKWELTHQAIAVAPNGQVPDGQHRLLAVLEAYRRNPNQQPIPLLICYNADPQTFAVIDSGKSRNASDNFAIAGLPHSSVVSQAARLLYCYLATRPGHKRDAAEASIPIEPSKWARIRVTNARLLEVVQANPQMADNITHTVGVSVNSKLSAGGLVVARYLITQACQNPEAVHDFFEILRTGQNLPYPDHSAFALRDWSLRRVTTEKVTRSVARTAFGPLVLRLTIMMWNHAVAGRPIAKPSYKPDGLVPEISSRVPMQSPAAVPIPEAA